MKKLILIFVFSAISCASLHAQVKNSPSIPNQSAELERLSREWTDAMLAHNKVKLEELMGSEYVLRTWDGNAPVTPRSVWMDVLFNRLKIVHWEQKSLSAQVFGDTGIVTSKYIWDGSMGDKSFTSKGYITDIWLRRNGRWQVVSRTSGAIPDSVTVDGKKATF